MIVLSELPTTNERILAQQYHERITGSTASTITLQYMPVRTADDVNLVRVFKNDSFLDDHGGAGGYTISGQTITLGTALLVGDVVHVFYPYRV